MIDIINNLIDLVILEKDRKEFARILSDMTDYCFEHFEKEEDYMKKMNYPHLDLHRKTHNEYKYNVAIYNANLLEVNPPDPQEIILYLKKWWTDHILFLDAQYEIFKNENNANARYGFY